MFINGLIVGLILGIFLSYYIQKWLNTRRDILAVKSKKNQDINFLFEHFPEFMNQIKTDLNDPAHKAITEFFVIDKVALMNSATPRLRYDLSETILPALNQLEALGLIEKIENDGLLYKITEELFTRLR